MITSNDAFRLSTDEKLVGCSPESFHQHHKNCVACRGKDSGSHMPPSGEVALANITHFNLLLHPHEGFITWMFAQGHSKDPKKDA
jgi:hypothetical protein